MTKAKKYFVYQNGKLASFHNFNVHSSWDQKEGFDSIEEAAKYAAMWAYPLSEEELSAFTVDMEPGVPVDMSMGYPGSVMMEVVEV